MTTIESRVCILLRSTMSKEHVLVYCVLCLNCVKAELIDQLFIMTYTINASSTDTIF